MGSASATVSIQFTFDSTETPGAWAVYTQGVTGLDFTEVPASTTCSIRSSYTAGETCSVAVRFAPRAPGLRMGAVQLMDLSGDVLATALLKGIGSAPQIVFPGNTASPMVGSGFLVPTGVAVDARGDVFVDDYLNNAVKEIVAVNDAVSSSSNVLTLTSGLNGVYSLAVDGSGDVFAVVGDGIKEMVAIKGAISSSSTVQTVGSGFNLPESVAVDSSGDVFVDDYLNNAVKEIVAVNGAVNSASMVVTLGGSGGFFEPCGVAVAANGNVFVAGSNTVAGDVNPLYSVNEIELAAQP